MRRGPSWSYSTSRSTGAPRSPAANCWAGFSKVRSRRVRKSWPAVSISWSLIRRKDEARARAPAEVGRKPGFEPETGRRHDDAVHGAGQGEQGVGGGRPPGREAPDRDGEVQRGAGEGRGDARRRGASAELEGRARPVLRSEAHRDRRSVHRIEG